MTTLAGKNVLITGSASGIGRLMAHQIAARGGNLILWDIDRPGLEALSEQLERWGHRAATYHQCDLSDPDDIADNAAVSWPTTAAWTCSSTTPASSPASRCWS